MTKPSDIVALCHDHPLTAHVLLWPAIPLSIYIGALSIHYLWALFLVPLGVMEIGLLHAWGIGFTVRHLVRRKPSWLVDKPEHEKSSDEHLADLLHANWTSILVGLLAMSIAYCAVAWFGPVVL